MDAKELMQSARNAALNAYAPYSRFRVGAALRLENGEIVTGVNVENRSFGLTSCAERSAINTMIGMGKQGIMAVAIVGLDTESPLSPCGACRQVLSEFCPPHTPVFYDDGADGYIISSIGELLPRDSLYDLSKI